jgi:transcription initiation factor IIE alpha subunit
MKPIVILTAFSFLLCQTLVAQKAGKVDTLKHTQYYSCPQHPDKVSHEPGKCPVCGMTMELSKKEAMKAKTMKNYQCPVHLDVTSHDPGKCPQCGRKLNLSAKEQMKAAVTKTYTCPMHPDIALDKDGKCPKCGKALVEKKQKTETPD